MDDEPNFRLFPNLQNLQYQIYSQVPNCREGGGVGS